MHVYNIYGGFFFYHTLTYVFPGKLTESFPWIPSVHCMWHLWARWNKWTNIVISCVFRRKGCLIVLTATAVQLIVYRFQFLMSSTTTFDYLLASSSIVFISSGRIGAAPLAKSVEMFVSFTQTRQQAVCIPLLTLSSQCSKRVKKTGG